MNLDPAKVSRFTSTWNETMLYLHSLDTCKFSYETERLTSEAQKNSIERNLEAIAIFESVSYFEKYGFMLLEDQ